MYLRWHLFRFEMGSTMYKVNSFVQKLAKIGVKVELVGNYPWIYLDTVNGARVTERFGGNHGFTAFMLGNQLTWTDRRYVFKKIRSML